MYKEQATLEADLEEANDMIDRLRASLDEVERQVLQGQRRYVDQVRTYLCLPLTLRKTRSRLSDWFSRPSCSTCNSGSNPS